MVPHGRESEQRGPDQEELDWVSEPALPVSWPVRFALALQVVTWVAVQAQVDGGESDEMARLLANLMLAVRSLIAERCRESVAEPAGLEEGRHGP